MPIILLTGRGQERDKIAALDLGADDYVVKPCSHRELLARIRAVWRRSSIPARILSASGMVLDPSIHSFLIEGQPVGLTTNEFLILLTLLERAGQVVRYSNLMRRVWGFDVTGDLLRVTMFRLRKKIEPDPKKPRYIHTVPGVGFLVYDDDMLGERTVAQNGTKS